MAILDIVILCCFVPAIVSGLRKGFVNQLVDLVSVIAGAWAAFRFSALVSNWLANYVTWDKNLLYVVSFAIIVVVAVLVLNLIGNMITKAVKIASLGWLNRIFGVLLGVLKTALIIGLLIMLFNNLNGQWYLVEPEKLEDCTIFNWLGDAANTVFPYFKNLLMGGTSADA